MCEPGTADHIAFGNKWNGTEISLPIEYVINGSGTIAIRFPDTFYGLGSQTGRLAVYFTILTQGLPRIHEWQQ